MSSIEIPLMFGIFSRGSRSCSRDDFKYCCLQRLNLKSDISERELDMLLNRRLEAKTHMDQDDFVKIFKDPIRRAQELRNEEATQ